MYHLDQLYSTFTQKWNEQYIKFCSMHTCIWYLKFWRNVTKLQLIMHTWYLSSWIVGLLSPTLNTGSPLSKSKCFCFNSLCSVFEMMSDIPSMQKPCWDYEPRCVISGGSDTAFWLTWGQMTIDTRMVVSWNIMQFVPIPSLSCKLSYSGQPNCTHGICTPYPISNPEHKQQMTTFCSWIFSISVSDAESVLLNSASHARQSSVV